MARPSSGVSLSVSFASALAAAREAASAQNYPKGALYEK
jgi:hypothetical protein